MGTHTRSSDETGCSTMATISFQCREKDVDGKKKLEVQVLSCKGLPDLDGAFNETDAYVVVRLGAGTDKPQKTEAVSGSLNPTFDPASSTFTFDNGPLWVSTPASGSRLWTRTPSLLTTFVARRASN